MSNETVPQMDHRDLKARAALTPDDPALPQSAADLTAQALVDQLTERDDHAALYLITHTKHWWQDAENRDTVRVIHTGRLDLMAVREWVTVVRDTYDADKRCVDWALLAAACELQGWPIAPLAELLIAINGDETALAHLVAAVRIASGMAVAK